GGARSAQAAAVRRRISSRGAVESGAGANGRAVGHAIAALGLLDGRFLRSRRLSLARAVATLRRGAGELTDQPGSPAPRRSLSFLWRARLDRHPPLGFWHGRRPAAPRLRAVRRRMAIQPRPLPLLLGRGSLQAANVSKRCSSLRSDRGM